MRRLFNNKGNQDERVTIACAILVVIITVLSKSMGSASLTYLSSHKVAAILVGVVMTGITLTITFGKINKVVEAHRATKSEKPNEQPDKE